MTETYPSPYGSLFPRNPLVQSARPPLRPPLPTPSLGFNVIARLTIIAPAMAAAAAASSAASKSRVATEQSYCLTDARALSLMTLFSPDEGKRAQSTAAAASAAAASTSASNSSTSFHLSQTVHCNVVGYSPDSSLHTFALHGVPERILAARRVDSTSQGQAAQFSYLIKWMRLPPRSATWISWETVALHIDMHKLALNQQNNRHPERVSSRGGDAQTTNAAGCTVVLTHQQQKAKWRAVEEHGLGAWGAIASLIRAFHRKHVDRTGNFKPPKPSAIRSCFTRRGAASLGRGLQVVRRLGTAVHVSDASVRQPSTETTSNGRHTLRRIPPHAHLPRTHLRTRQLQRARQVEEFAIQPLHGRVSRVVKHERALALHRRWCTHTDCGEPRTSA